MSLHSPVWVVQNTTARGPGDLLLVVTRVRSSVYKCVVVNEAEGLLNTQAAEEEFYGSRLMAQDRCAKMAEEQGT